MWKLYNILIKDLELRVNNICITDKDVKEFKKTQIVYTMFGPQKLKDAVEVNGNFVLIEEIQKYNADEK